MAGTKQHATPVGSPSDDTDTTGHMLETSSLKDQDRFLPIANVSRIMKKALPSNAKISKEAKETVQECVSEFISFITGEASDKCQREKRKTINGEDLLWAMTTLGFENYVGTLKTYLSKYRDTEEEKNCMARQGDQSPTQETELSSTRHHRRQSITGDPKTTGRFFSVGAAGIPPTYGDQGRGIAYGEKGKSNSSFYTSTSYENEGKNANNVVWY